MLSESQDIIPEESFQFLGWASGLKVRIHSKCADGRGGGGGEFQVIQRMAEERARGRAGGSN